MNLKLKLSEPTQLEFKFFKIEKLERLIKETTEKAHKAWHEANSIPSGCGCTPFIADARALDRKIEELKVQLEVLRKGD